MRATVYATGEPDTFFSIPAVCRLMGKRVKGYLTIETCHPYYYDCPKSIFGLLTAPITSYSKEWRENVQKRLAKRQPKKGEKIKFSEPITFQNGEQISEFEFVSHSTFRVGFRHYRISGWKSREFEIIG